MEFDDINDLTYSSETDYFSYGKVNIFDGDGILVNSFDVSVSPGNFAFDVRTSTGINNVEEINISLYPNPTADKVMINAATPIKFVIITDMTGKKLMEYNDVNSANFTAEIKDLTFGSYLISITTDTNTQTQIISKI